MLKKTCTVLTVAGVIGSGLVALAPFASADPAIAGTYNAVTPVRVLNTRAGAGAAKAAVGPNKSITFNATGSLSTSNISAEALTITATNGTAAGYLLAYPGGTAQPATSTLNYQANTPTANSAIIGYGTSGSVTIYNKSTGTVDVLADLFGYWTGGSVSTDTAGAFTSVPSTRILNTLASGGAPVQPGGDLAVPVSGTGGVPDDNSVSAVAVNITVPTPAKAGYLTGTANPTDQQASDSVTSDIAFTAGQNHANLDIVPVDPDTGSFSLHNGSVGEVNVLVDIVGYFSGGSPVEDGSFLPTTPYRSNDTRTTAPIGAGKTAVLALGVNSNDSPALFKAVVANLTVTGATAPGYLVAWNGSGAVPPTSNLNFAAHQTTANSIITQLSTTGTISVYNGSKGTVNVVLDVHGFVLNDVTGGNAANRARTQLRNARRAAATRMAS